MFERPQSNLPRCSCDGENKPEGKATIKCDGAATHQTSEYVPDKILKTSQVIRKRHARDNDDENDSHDDEPGLNITPDMKKRLQQSTWLRKELQDGGLRHLIGMIDAASDDDEENGDNNKRFHSKKARRNAHEEITPRVLALARIKNSHPKFASFIDRLLLTAGVLQPAEGTDGDSRGPLSLVPIPRRPGAGNLSVDSSTEDHSDSDNSDDSGDSSRPSEEQSDSSEGEDGRNIFRQQK
eukprot:CCRYP_017220-RC/>CCRYP_017220-RC protein AED:0.19 eAED:0.27 QI:0/0/0.5/1/0/0/2/412/238